MKVERRFIGKAELRAAVDARKITGHAALFNGRTELWPGLVEEIAPGAFSESIRQDDVRALFNHNPDFVLGRNVAGTLTLAEDVRGLAFEVDVPDTQWARDLLVSMDRGDISGASFGFRVQSEEWRREDDVEIRRITKAQLFDVSPVTYPAYEAAYAEARSAEQLADIRARRDQAFAAPAPDADAIATEQRRARLRVLRHTLGAA